MAKFMALTEVGSPDRPVLINLDNAKRIRACTKGELPSLYQSLVGITVIDMLSDRNGRGQFFVRETLAEIYEALRIWPSPTPAQIKALEKIKETAT